MTDRYSYIVDPFRTELSQEGLPTLQDEAGCSLIACASFVPYGRQILDTVAVKCLICHVRSGRVIGENEDFEIIAAQSMQERVEECEYWKKLPKNRDTV